MKKTPKVDGFLVNLMIFTVIFALIYFLMDTSEKKEIKEITYKDFQSLVEEGRLVGPIKVSDNLVQGDFFDKDLETVVAPLVKKENVSSNASSLEEKIKVKKFLLAINLKTDTTFLSELKSKGVPYVYRQTEDTSFLMTIIQFTVVGFLVFFLFKILFKSSGAGGISSRIPGINNSKHTIIDPSEIRVGFRDVQGIDEVKTEVQEIIDFISNPEKYTKVGAQIPRGILLEGDPGTGKTMLAKAIAKESGSPFIPVAGSEFIEMFVGLGAQRVRSLFATAREAAAESGKTCIIFIDEIDAVGGKRGSNAASGGHSEQEQTLNQLLTEIDGFATQPGHVIIIGATNRAETLDSALKREGRFDRTVRVPLPDVKGRKKILEVHTQQLKKIPLSDDVDLLKIARGTAGFSGAKLEALANEAAIFAAREDRVEVNQQDFEKAKDKILMGIEQRSLVVSEAEKRKTAIHEAGHALISVIFKDVLDPLHKVSIVPRGNALGVTVSLPSEEKALNLTKTKIDALISMMMGGRIAEEVFFDGELSTGASSDIERATQLARGMVYSWGMSEMGPVNLENDNQFNSRFSETTRAKADGLVVDIVKQNYDKAKELIRKHKNVINLIADELMEKETIDGTVVEEIYVKSTSV